MSQYTAELFGLTQQELLELLEFRPVDVLLRPKPTIELPNNAGDHNIVVFSIVLLSIAAVAFVISSLLWCSYKKTSKKIERESLLRKRRRAKQKAQKDVPEVEPRHDKPSMDTSRMAGPEAPLFSDDELQKISVVATDITANYYSYRERLQVNLRRIALGPITEILSQNAYIYTVIVVEPNEDVFFESTLRPVAEENHFSETSDFDIFETELPARHLKLSVFVCDRFSRHRLVCELVYQLEIGEADSRSEDASAKDSTDSKRQLSVLPVVLKKLASRNGSRSSDRAGTKVGEVMLSLCYMPTSGRLTFAALKGRHLSKASEIPKVTYLRASLMVGGKALKTVQTSTVGHSSSPVYNEAFLFHAPLESMNDAHINLTAMIQDQHTEAPVALGEVVVGPESFDNIGRKHWEMMLISPRKSVAQWHEVQRK